ncbi:hypothetical protein G6F46_007073 [Rhizopus delemar]|nr:hypothetical protein G6F55_006932 [Rhizopus delemar]KAG1542591.1 hypothetical protein G6F51_007181 [Rhizopus arrhizus]KAG1496577.1 hypothetical protein G6F54_006369 [Rhizopus delemar]KAG1514809.1 hypothetical protein G6F53_003396 [Rhizopus delemar]KAG1525829.1 hypothetical protein G6F52_002974 [Rhizopus delemar]
MSLILEFCRQIIEGYTNQDAEAFYHLFSIDPSNPITMQLREELDKTDLNQIKNTVESILEDTSNALVECVNSYMEAVVHFQNSDVQTFFDIFANFYSSTIPVFNGQDTFYMVPLINTLSSYLVQLAFEADSYGLKGKARKANSAARLLSKMFNIMLADRSPMETSKRLGIFHVTNLAFKVYFKLNTTRMCQTFMNNIKTGGVDLKQYPISEQVTYRYYLGRYALYHVKLHQAQDHLMFAFKRCHAEQWHNKRLILHHLIPTYIIMGYFPKIELLEKYKLVDQYWNLLQALKAGDLAGYSTHLEIHFDYFYSNHTYSLLKDRGIVLAWRCLVKKVYLLTKKSETHSIVLFKDCLKAFRLCDPECEYTMDEIECILVSLVSQGYIRGYLHHQKQRLVLSRVNGFPPVSQVRLYQERYNEAAMEDHMKKAYPPIPEEINKLIEDEEHSSTTEIL